MLENKYETEYWNKDQYIMGIDEAGRGPLCGPLVVACCILPINYVNDEINDSLAFCLSIMSSLMYVS